MNEEIDTLLIATVTLLLTNDMIQASEPHSTVWKIATAIGLLLVGYIVVWVIGYLATPQNESS